MLRSVVEATVALFEAEAASIALYDAATDRLVFEVAAGEQGQGVIGVSIATDQGIAGYVFTTGQALALSDVASDPRFGKAVAAQTDYMPRSLVAVPLVDEHGTIGVLEVLDKHSQAAFSLRDIELAGVFARQAAVAISASRVERDVASLLRATLADLAPPSGGGVRRDRGARRGGHRGPGPRGRDAPVGSRRAGRARPTGRPRGAGARDRPAGRPGAPRRARGPEPSRPRRIGPCPRPVSDLDLPAWSEPFVGERGGLDRLAPLRAIDRAWAFGGVDGSGVTVAVIDSGVERDHPAVGGRLVESVRVEPGDDEPVVMDDPEAIDVVGHGTACAGIIHGLAPGADIISVRVLGPDNRGKGAVFAAGLEWAIAHGAAVVNLSLSSKSEAMFATFHDLADRAYFANVLLVCAANNVPAPSYPSLFASVISVAAHDVADPVDVVLQPAPAGRVRGVRGGRPGGLEGRGAHGRDGQQLRRAAHRRPRRAHPRQAPCGDPVRGQGHPRGDRHRGATRGLTLGLPPVRASPRSGRGQGCSSNASNEYEATRGEPRFANRSSA